MRNILKLTFVLLSYCSVVLNATESSRSSNISTLVERVKSSKPENRRALINELKIRLRSENKEIRRAAMMDLRKTFNSSNPNRKHFQLGKRRGKNKNCQNENLSEHKRKNKYRTKKVQNPQHKKKSESGKGQHKGK